jgi:hypothetical protein
LYNETYTPSRPEVGQQAWDNHIAGVDYERDVLGLARDLHLRAEVGIDNRFGHYLVCCLIPLPGDPRTYPERTVRSNGLVHSVELWAGGKVRWENFKLGGVSFEVAGAVGLSGVTRAIGRERQRQIELQRRRAGRSIRLLKDRLRGYGAAAVGPPRAGCATRNEGQLGEG